MSNNGYETFIFVYRFKDNAKLSLWEKNFLESKKKQEKLLAQGCSILSSKQLNVLVKISEKISFGSR